MAYSLTSTKYLNSDERELLLKVLERYSHSDPRDTTLILTALYTGARASELLGLTREDLDGHYGTVFIRGIKGSLDREIPIPEWLFTRLKSLCNESSERVFPITYWRFAQIWYLYRPVKKKLHALRHTFAIDVYKKTRDLRLLQMALGHKNFKNTLIYAQYQFSREEMRKIL